MKSEHFDDANIVFQITTRRFTDMTAVEANTSHLGTLTLPNAIWSQLGRDGFFNAVFNTSGAFYSNTWLLRCT